MLSIFVRLCHCTVTIAVLTVAASALWLPDDAEAPSTSTYGREIFYQDNFPGSHKVRLPHISSSIHQAKLVEDKPFESQGKSGQLNPELITAKKHFTSKAEDITNASGPPMLFPRRYSHKERWIDNLQQNSMGFSTTDSPEDGSGWFGGDNDDDGEGIGDVMNGSISDNDTMDELSDDVIWANERKEERLKEELEMAEYESEIRKKLGIKDNRFKSVYSRPQTPKHMLIQTTKTTSASQENRHVSGGGISENQNKVQGEYFDNGMYFDDDFEDIPENAYQSPSVTENSFPVTKPATFVSSALSGTTTMHNAEHSGNAPIPKSSKSDDQAPLYEKSTKGVHFPAAVFMRDKNTNEKSNTASLSTATSSTSPTTEHQLGNEIAETSPTPCLQDCQHSLDQAVLTIESERVLTEIGMNITIVCQLKKSEPSRLDLESLEVGWRFKKNEKDEACWLTDMEVDDEERCESHDAAHQTQTVNQTAVLSRLDVIQPSPAQSGLYLCSAYIRCCDGAAHAQLLHRDVIARLRIYSRPKYAQHIVATFSACLVFLLGIGGMAFVKRRRRRKKAEGTGGVLNYHYQPVRMLQLPEQSNGSKLSVSDRSVPRYERVGNDDDHIHIDDDFDDADDFGDAPVPAQFPSPIYGTPGIHVNRLSELPLPTPPPTPPVGGQGHLAGRNTTAEDFPRPPSSVLQRFNSQNNDDF